MKLYTDGITDFEPWAGAVGIWDAIQEYGQIDDLENALYDLYPDGMSITNLNDLLWFEPETVCEWVGLYYNDGNISDIRL